MEYYENRLCVTFRELVDSGIMTAGNYKKLKSRGRLEVVRTAGGAGTSALIALDSLPEKYFNLACARFKVTTDSALSSWLLEHYSPDPEAIAFFFDEAKAGIRLTQKQAAQAAVNAAMLNDCLDLVGTPMAYIRYMGPHFKWEMLSKAVNGIRQKIGHTLPKSRFRLHDRIDLYKEGGYASLVDHRIGNSNARKVNGRTEKLIISLACQPNKPFGVSVVDMYNRFISGELEVFDPETGEIFNPEEFKTTTGQPLKLTAATIYRYLNKPANKVIVAKALWSWPTFMHEQMPYVHRHAPQYSLSKVSFDDRDLPRKLRDTRQRPKAYYAYDVASQCVIGVAYNRRKNVDLVIECFRSMFHLLEDHGWGCPAQVEVENHLMSQWKNSFLKAGEMFPFVRFCAPQNSQEKYAEAMNGSKKRTIEHKNHLGVGRFYARNDKYRTESIKVFDDLNDTYVEKEYYTWDELIADDRSDVQEFNNSLHPNQEKYPGMTRWQVFEANINPGLKPINRKILTRYVGEHEKVVIRRNSFITLHGTDWWLSSVSVLPEIDPTMWELDAYFWRGSDGKITDVWLWQGDKCIDRLENLGTFNSADAEQTDEDRAVFEAQMKRIAKFNKWVKDNMAPTVRISESVQLPAADEPQPLPEPEPEPGADSWSDSSGTNGGSADDIRRDALDSL